MRLLRTAGFVLALGALAAGCAYAAKSAPAPTGTPGAATTPTQPDAAPVPGRTKITEPVRPGTAGSDGLTVRYRDTDGSMRTVRVEDFPR